MKTEKIILALLFGATATYAQTDQLSSSIHQFVVTDIDGNPFHFNSLKREKGHGSQYGFKMWFDLTV